VQGIEGGGEIDKTGDSWLLVPVSMFKNAAQRKDLVDTAASASETGLVDTGSLVAKGLETVEQYSGEYFSQRRL
jgi:hypothetical protein